MDGKTYSNTLFFEKELEFKGMLIEPIPHLFDKLIKFRPNNICENYAIDVDETGKLFIGNNATAGLFHSMNDSHLNTWHKNSKKYKTNTIRLDKLLHKHNITYIDFFSIDVEGGEYILLKSMDWNIPVYIICIELDNNNIDKDNACRKIYEC